MAKVIVNSDEAPKSMAGYSQAVKSGGFVFVAGQGPFDARTKEGDKPTYKNLYQLFIESGQLIKNSSTWGLDMVGTKSWNRKEKAINFLFLEM